MTPTRIFLTIRALNILDTSTNIYEVVAFPPQGIDPILAEVMNKELTVPIRRPSKTPTFLNYIKISSHLN